MNRREVMLSTADFLQANPERYDFCQVVVPGSSGYHTKGCVLGWMAAISGCERAYSVTLMAEDLTGVDESSFFARLDTLSLIWRQNPGAAARALRAYVEKYEPAEVFPMEDKPLPAWAQLRDREAVEEERKGKCPKEAYKRFRFQLVLEPRTIMPSEVSEEVSSASVSS